jgi:hypothetical protein
MTEEEPMLRRIIAAAVLPLFILSGCASYKTQYASFRPPEQYLYHVETDGVKIGAEAYADKDAADNAFGFDIKGAGGLLPVQLVLDNKSHQSIGGYWNIIPTNVAIDRLEKSTQLAAFFGSDTAKGALIGAAAGTILAAAIGIVAGHDIGSTIGKGAVIGGAGGAIIGGAKGGTSPERPYRITEDIRQKGLEGKAIPAGYLANGFLFFPGEAESAKELRLQIREKETGTIRLVTLRLK